VNPFDSAESISLCFREALKGRLVLSHCYSRDTAEALAYLLGMGVEPALMGSSLLGIVAQRNIRLNCPQCQEKDPIHRDRVKEMGIPIAMQPTSFYRGKGCRSCLKTGFDRESSIFEVIEMTDELRNRLVPGIKTDDIRDILRSTGTMTLRQIAVHKAVNGQTSLFEVLRVTP
jgi:type II secretory ATPase GspE/PulE/Tfp pilus assembly ATPase PilB-like protein